MHTKSNMKNILLLCILFMAPQFAEAFSVFRVQQYTGARWKSFPVEFQLSSAGHSSTVTDGSDRDAFFGALGNWSGVMGSTLDYRYVIDEVPHTCKLLKDDNFSPDPLVNVFCFSQNFLTDILNSNGTIALGGYISGGDRIERAFLIFNEETQSFKTNTANTGDNNAFYLEGVVLHEMGHTMGLNHSTNSEAVMYYSTNQARSKDLMPFLAADDINGVRYLYPKQEFFGGIGCAPVENVGQGGLTSFLFSLPFLLLIMYLIVRFCVLGYSRKPL